MAEPNKAQDVKQSFNQATAAVKESARATGDAARQNADAGADVARQGTEAGLGAMNRAGNVASETTLRGAQAMVEGQRQIVQEAAERFEEVSRKMVQATQGTTENVRRFMTLPTAAEGGLRDMQQGVTSLFEGMVQTNMRVAQEMFRLSSPAPFVELQQRFVREYTDTLVQNSAALVRAMRRTAEETLRPLEEQIRKTDQSFQAAAE